MSLADLDDLIDLLSLQLAAPRNAVLTLVVALRRQFQPEQVNP